MGFPDRDDEQSSSHNDTDNVMKEEWKSKEAIESMLVSRTKLDILLNQMCFDGKTGKGPVTSLWTDTVSLLDLQNTLQHSLSNMDYFSKLNDFLHLHSNFEDDSCTLIVSLAWIRRHVKDVENEMNMHKVSMYTQLQNNPIQINGIARNTFSEYNQALEFCSTCIPDSKNTLYSNGNMARLFLQSASHLKCFAKVKSGVETLFANDAVVTILAKRGYVQPIELSISVDQYGDYWGIGGTIKATYTFFIQCNDKKDVVDDDDDTGSTDEENEDDISISPSYEPVPLQATYHASFFPSLLDQLSQDGDDSRPEDSERLDLTYVSEYLSITSDNVSRIGMEKTTKTASFSSSEPEEITKLFQQNFEVEKADYVQVYKWDLPQGDDSKSVPILSRPREYICRSSLGRNRIAKVASSPQHTLMLSDLGEVFSCGQGLDGALGNGSDMNSEIPRVIEWFHEQTPRVLICDVSCGGDLLGLHSGAVSHSGKVYTWGNGTACGSGNLKACLLPQQVRGKIEAVPCVSISCGGSFSIARTEKGELFSWGLWANGRLGQGAIPRRVTRGRRNTSRKQLQKVQCHAEQVVNLEGRCIMQVACGTAHVVAVDKRGRIVVWGQGSHGQLGTGKTTDSLLPLPLNLTSSFHTVAAGPLYSLAITKKGNLWSWGAWGASALGHGEDVTASYMDIVIRHHRRVLGKHPELPQFDWLRPRKVLALGSDDIVVKSVAAGSDHAAAVSSTGDLYIWGPMHGQNDAILLATCSNLPSLGDQVVESIACAGAGLVAITCGSFLGQDLRTIYLEGRDVTFRHDVEFELGSKAKYFDQLTACDVALIVDGKRLFAHKIILSRRCSILRDLIVSEERPNRGVTLIIPDLRYEVMELVLEYIYSDNVYTPLDPNSPTPRDLYLAALQLELPRLQEIAKNVILPGVFQEEDETHVVPSQLAYDLSGAVNDGMWSDILIVAEGREIHAHQCILTARSEYFKAVFAHGMKESQQHVVNVQESYLTMLRVITFMYTDTLKEASDDVLLEDLIAADRFGLVRMKLLCEHMIYVTPSNCLNTLAVSEMVHASTLKERSMRNVGRHLSRLHGSTPYKELMKQCPHLQHEILERVQGSNNRAILRDWNATVQVKQNELKEKQSPDPVFPWGQISAWVLCALSYVLIAQMQNMGVWIPTLNVIVFMMAVLAGVFNMTRE